MKEYAIELMEKGKRIDGRKLDEFRRIEIEKNVVQKAEGSALVKLGETQVIAGVKLEIGEPFPDSPDQGVLIVSAEFSPLASPDFEAGPPSEDAIELARIVDRGIRESKAIELEKLCIEAGKKVLSVFVDIHIINHQGNLLDASALASLVALLSAKVPKLGDGKIVRSEYEKDLPLVHKPINITVCKIKDKLFLDPSLEEESIVESKLSVAVREDGNICALQKQGSKGLSLEEIENMVEIAVEKSKEIRKLIE